MEPLSLGALNLWSLNNLEALEPQQPWSLGASTTTKKLKIPETRTKAATKEANRRTRLRTDMSSCFLLCSSSVSFGSRLYLPPSQALETRNAKTPQPNHADAPGAVSPKTRAPDQTQKLKSSTNPKPFISHVGVFIGRSTILGCPCSKDPMVLF